MHFYRNFLGISTKYPRCSSTLTPIKAMSINTDAFILAIAFIDGSIHFCDIIKNTWNDLQLHHEKQIQPSYLSWRPYCQTHIACCAKYIFIFSINYNRNGLCIWKIRDLNDAGRIYSFIIKNINRIL